MEFTALEQFTINFIAKHGKPKARQMFSLSTMFVFADVEDERERNTVNHCVAELLEGLGISADDFSEFVKLCAQAHKAGESSTSIGLLLSDNAPLPEEAA